MKSSVLIVEDDPLSMAAYKNDLESRGYEVFPIDKHDMFSSIVESGRRFDLAIVDLMLNRNSRAGLAIARDIKSRKIANKIVLVTAWPKHVTESDLAELGIQYRVKPCTVDDILEGWEKTDLGGNNLPAVGAQHTDVQLAVSRDWQRESVLIRASAMALVMTTIGIVAVMLSRVELSNSVVFILIVAMAVCVFGVIGAKQPEILREIFDRIFRTFGGNGKGSGD